MLFSDQKNPKTFLFLFFPQYQQIACWHPNPFSKWARSSLTSVKVLGVHLANRIAWKVTPESDNMNTHEQADKNWDCSSLSPTPNQWCIIWRSNIYQLKQSLPIWIRHDVYSLQRFVQTQNWKRFSKHPVAGIGLQVMMVLCTSNWNI